jgi:cellulose biosynthesis protein BcsQ
MPTISILSLKGGVGKTSVTLGLAGAATVRGLATLVIDLDPQGNATSILAADQPDATAADVLARPSKAGLECALTPCAWEVEPGEVDVIASDPDLIKHDAWNGGPLDPKLATALAHLEGYDLVLIDCPPSLGQLTRQALAASDLAVVVTTPSYFGAQGVDRAYEEIEEIRRTTNRSLKIAGIIVNRVRSTADEHDYRMKELASIHGRTALLQPVIPERIAIQQAEGMGMPVQTVRTQGGREVSEMFDTHLTRLLKMGSAE